MDIKDYYLDLEKLLSLETDAKALLVSGYYNDLLHGGHPRGGSISTSLFNTLYKSGYLLSHTTENRDEKIGDVLN